MEKRKQEVSGWMEGLRQACTAEGARKKRQGESFPTVVGVAAPGEADAVLLSGAKEDVVPHVVDSDMLVTCWYHRQGGPTYVEFRHTIKRKLMHTDTERQGTGKSHITRHVRVCVKTAHNLLGSTTEAGANAAAATVYTNDFTQKPRDNTSESAGHWALFFYHGVADAA